MAGGLSTGETAGLIVAGSGLLFGIGKGIVWFISWLSGRLDARALRLDEREADLERKINERLSALEKDVQKLSLACDKWREAFLIVAQEQLSSNPASPALKRAQKLLAEAFPLHLTIPPDMQGELDRLQ